MNSCINRHNKLIVNRKKLNEIALVTAIRDKEILNEQIARLRLGETSKNVYKNLNMHLQLDSLLCVEILRDDYYFSKKKALYNILIHSDKRAWNKLCKKCNAVVSQNKQSDLLATKIASWLPDPVMQNKFHNVIDALDSILFNDQYYRKIMLYEKDSTLWKYQYKYDKENLTKVESIIKHNGYLNMNEVGLLHHQTIWLVIHHQTDCGLRKRYEEYFQKLVNSMKLPQNSCDLYVSRTKQLCN